MLTDPISDMLIQLKNASMVGKPSVSVTFSNLKMEIAKVLEKNGFIKAPVKKGKKIKKVLACDLVYGEDKKAKIADLVRVSKPSRRVYIGAKELGAQHLTRGIMVISTPKGIMTGQEARQSNVGGEVLFRIW